MVANPNAPELSQAFLRPQTETGADVETRLRELGYEIQDVYYRGVGNNRLPTIIETGTDRVSTSELYTDDNVDFESINRYEELAMYTHNIEDRRFTTYVHDGRDTTNINSVAQSRGHQVLLFYPKGDGVIPVKAADYNPRCVRQSGGFALFTREPSELLLGVAIGGKFYTPGELREAAPQAEAALVPVRT